MVVQRPQKVIGVILLMLVNVVWVGASELARYLFVDLNFKRPFFYTYVKSCMLSLFMLRYACNGIPSDSKSSSDQTTIPHGDAAFYTKLQNSEDEEDEEYCVESLTNAEFEPITLDIESSASDQLSAAEDTNQLLSYLMEESQMTDESVKIKRQQGRSRRVRFSMFREVRKIPDKIALDAKLARLPYRPKAFKCREICPAVSTNSLVFNYSIYFAPLWLASSVTYHAALVYSSLSTVNLITSSSSLFVLVLGALFGRHPNDNFTLTKLLLVVLNLAGVAIVSQFSGSWLGSALSLLSAFTNALWLLVFSNVSSRLGRVDMNLLLGITGLFTLFICSPLMLLVHETGVESQLPAPNRTQMAIVVFNGFFGTLLGDLMWLYATLLTSSLVSSISMTLSIPLSLIADTIFRKQPPSAAQLIASIPILISFIGSSLLTSSPDNSTSSSSGESKSFTKNRKLTKESISISAENGTAGEFIMSKIMIDGEGANASESVCLMQQDDDFGET